MKPREILRTIIKNNGNCEWVGTNGKQICTNCPLRGDHSCPTTVSKIAGDAQDKNYLKVAQQMLEQMEIELILLGERNDS